jgi:hypothetical protein
MLLVQSISTDIYHYKNIIVISAYLLHESFWDIIYAVVVIINNAKRFVEINRRVHKQSNNRT